MHEQYEELCALAATGQITGDAMAVLDEHVRACDECRAFLQDLAPIKAEVAPVMAGSHVHYLEPPEGIRDRFLKRAQAVGLGLYNRPAVAAAESCGVARPSRASGGGPKALFQQSLWFALPAAAAIALAFIGWRAIEPGFQSHLAEAPPTLVREARTEVLPAKVAVEPQISSKQQEQKEKELDEKLKSVQTEKNALSQTVADLTAKAAAGEQSEKQLSSALSDLREANARITELQAELEREKEQATEATAVAVVQQKMTDDIAAKVASLQEQLDAQQDLSAAGKSLAEEMIAARNLHIVDVYDSDSSGDHSAFGRVFYVEGKSLVFYAYNLPMSVGNKKVEFRVWGEKAGVQSVSISLGALRSDNSSQGRWVLACNDPKLLGRINAVYITTDSPVRPGKEPHGSKMMYAFLSSPNHP